MIAVMTSTTASWATREATVSPARAFRLAADSRTTSERRAADERGTLVRVIVAVMTSSSCLQSFDDVAGFAAIGYGKEEIARREVGCDAGQNVRIRARRRWDLKSQKTLVIVLRHWRRTSEASQ